MAIEFEPLTPGKLAKTAIVPQVLDNQWVPRKLLPDMIKKGKNLQDIKASRKKYIIKEWRRALIYGSQVIVNRAYLINNDVVVNDYKNKEDQIEFRKLINDRAIIPFLYDEENLEQKPRFSVGINKWNQWLNLLKDTYPACVRFNWANQSTDHNKISSSFHKYVKCLDTPYLAESFANYLSIPQNNIAEFKKQLFKVANFTSQFGQENNKFITRDILYKNFVSVEGTSVDDGLYRDEPFASDLKQIFDLKYNVNIPDALGRFSLTPEDSLPRSALGDLYDSLEVDVISESNIKGIIQSLQTLTFENISSGLFLKNLAFLSLADVNKIRKMDEWKNFIIAENDLIKNPLDFANKSNYLYIRFTDLNREITKLKESNLKAKWQPRIKLSILIGLTTIEILIDLVHPDLKLINHFGAELATAGATSFALRLAITAQNQRANADLDMSLDIMRGKISNYRDTFNEILGTIKSKPGFKLLQNVYTSEFDSNNNIPQPLE